MPEGFEVVPCDFCRSHRQAKLFEIHESADDRLPVAWRGVATIPIVRCEDCGLAFLSPRYSRERLRALYQDPQLFLRSIDPDGRERSIAAERMQRVARFKIDAMALHRIRPLGRLLDVGCGPGFFLEALGSEYEAFGLEWSCSAVEMARKLGFQVVEDCFPHHPFTTGEFDIVTFHNVLDHLPEPMQALRAARDLLKPGGVLMLSLVNFGSPAAQLYGPGFRLLGANHLYYFTPTTLRRALRFTGFRLLQINYPYFGTEFAHPLGHSWRFLADWWALRVMRKLDGRVSPPFYGNMMHVFAIRSESRPRGRPA